MADASVVTLDPPVRVGSRDFVENKYAYYRLLREQAPVCPARISVLKVHLVSRYADCVELLKDPRFVRNRATATGGSRMPFPVPRSVALMAQSMIVEDEPGHRRMRGLVQKAFTPRALERLEGRIEGLTEELLDAAEAEARRNGGRVDLIQAYSLPIPVTVISEMMGVPSDEMPKFVDSMRVLFKGFSGWSFARAFLWDLPRSVRFLNELIASKRAALGEDILSGLIQAEEAGDSLSQDELVSMVFLLIVAGYETTVHLITNGVLALLQHPEQLAHLRAEPSLLDSAVEEILRYRGPVHGTKPGYALEEVELHGVRIPKGVPVVPLLGAANHDREVFEDPERFDIARAPNRHLGFGHGIHHCLGAPLARMETRIALGHLLERNPNLGLAVEPSQLRLQKIPMWHRYEALPVVLG